MSNFNWKQLATVVFCGISKEKLPSAAQATFDFLDEIINFSLIDSEPLFTRWSLALRKGKVVSVFESSGPSGWALSPVSVL